MDADEEDGEAGDAAAAGDAMPGTAEHTAPGTAGHLAPGAPERELHIVVRGSGFLYNMVRIITGTLIEVGRGHRPPQYIDELLAHPDRQNAGPTAPPNGLCLEWIKYD